MRRLIEWWGADTGGWPTAIVVLALASLVLAGVLS
jgi:hypothetical protein